MIPSHSLQDMNRKNTSSTTRSVLIWGIGDIYFIVSVVVAILFGMLSPDIQKQLHLNETQLGILGSVFFLCYGLAQLVGGRLMDSWGPRLTLTISALITSSGLFIFSQAESFTQILVAQTLSGIGLSTSYIGAIFLASTWFTADRFPLVSGITQMSADLMAVIVIAGIVFSGILLLGFPFTMRCLALIVLCIALLLFVFVRGAPLAQQTAPVNKKAALWSDMHVLISIPQFWLGTLYFSAAFGVLMAFSNLWNIPNQLSYGHSLQSASIMTAMLPLGGAVGSAVSGWLTALTKRGARIALFYSAGMFVISVVLIYGPLLSTSLTVLLLILLGFFFGGAVLGFPLVSQHMPATLKGTGFGLMATIAYLLSALLQYLVGALLGENAALPSGITAIHDFKIALSPLVITLAIGCIGSLWLRDK
jgi:sugar phosphate permease